MTIEQQLAEAKQAYTDLDRRTTRQLAEQRDEIKSLLRNKLSSNLQMMESVVSKIDNEHQKRIFTSLLNEAKAIVS